MVRLDFDLARNLLEQLFSEAQRAFESHQPPTVDHSVRRNAETLFNSNTQSYREVLLGCGLARLLDHTIDIRQPYVGPIC
jgi:predicted component of type VI protein secretion system